MNQTLPPLTHPSPNGNLIGEAEQDRAKTLAALEAFLRQSAGDQPAALVDEMVALYREVALRRTEASRWLGDVHARVGGVQRFARDIAGQFTDDDKQRLTALAARRETQ